ncbi:MAG TPA: 3-dehydroquinate synthase [Hypericibacter adhaerens]|uniref:3-dehydroquinate synthase n=1 Tax=Hypericibacter adhaerens TaxID=2602016 RepID=UPI002CAD5A92|nr:3-dehydroquinate synthase [Hypericibacter adhaerens]HWA43012.1 3-dehydroquinate synthase [Hypericibacter adhaerens]
MNVTASGPAAEIGRLAVDLGSRRYEILVGGGLIARAGSLVLPLLKNRCVLIVTDATVGRLYLEELVHSLEAAGIRQDSIVLPPGEATKDFRHLEELCSRLLEARIERNQMILALGGGVIGDITGFAASIVLRGVDFIQIPTTLLAQVDSSVGGKTGINTAQGKNLVGSFYQPRLVLADIDALDSLPRRELLAGYAEVVKYGLINDPAFFSWLETHGADLVEGDTAARRQAVMTSCAAKAAVVAADEREADQRALLNLGHTFGHALEAECGYTDELLHGEAVAIGMVMAFELSAMLGLSPPEDTARLVRHLAAVGLPTSPAAIGRDFDADRLIHHMQQDKKVKDGRLTFVLARGIGRAFVSREVEPAQLEALLARSLAA